MSVVRERYATWLAGGTAVGVGLMLVGFAAYLSGALAPSLPLHELPTHWGLSAAELMHRNGLRPGLSWLGLLPRADAVSLAGVALLAGCSVPALAAVIPAFAREGRRAYAVICALEILVIVAAASGILGGAGH